METHNWYTKVAETTVLPVPGGPCIMHKGVANAFLTASV